jgi:autophagy-related protein 16
MFSSDGDHVAVGSNDGSIYIWNTETSNMLPVLKEHTSVFGKLHMKLFLIVEIYFGLTYIIIIFRCQVQAVAWHPHANWLASVDKSKKAIIWSDA